MPVVKGATLQGRLDINGEPIAEAGAARRFARLSAYVMQATGGGSNRSAVPLRRRAAPPRRPPLGTKPLTPVPRNRRT